MPPTHRSNPLPGTMEGVPGYPSKLRLYRIEASRFWQIRYYLDGKILKKSARTEEKQKAIAAAKKFWTEIHLRHEQKLPLTSSLTFEKSALDLLRYDQERVDRGERKARLVSDQRTELNYHIIPFFKGHHVRHVTFKRLVELAADLQKKGLSPASIKMMLHFTRKVLKHAHKLDLLDRLPIFPTITVHDNPRPWFSSEQYAHLRKTVVNEIKNHAVVRAHPVTDEMRYLITFMVNTFLRPGDIKNLKHKNIDVVDKSDAKYLRISPSTGKTNTSPTVSMPDAVGIYENLRHLNGDTPDDYVFFPKLKNRDFALQTMRRQFDHILKEANLKKAASGGSRTLYSLRHTAIMFRLTKGDSIDPLTLARNARTSVQMIERFYGKHLTGEMNVDKLQSMKTTGVRRKRTTKPTLPDRKPRRPNRTSS
jgi:integrase